MLIAQAAVPDGALGWVTQVAAAAAVVATVVIFIWYLNAKDDKAEKAFTKLSDSLDKNTEALGRADAVADRWERFLDSKGM